MIDRQRLIPMGIAGLLGAAMAYMMLNALLISPARELGARSERLRRDIGYRGDELSAYTARARRLPSLAAQTFGHNGDLASEQVRARLVTLIQRSGLPADAMSLKPITGARVKDYYAEVGWSLSVRGRLEQAVNLLYLLDAEPYLHRVETLSLSPMGEGEQVDLKLRFTTIVLPAEEDRALAAGEFASADAAADLGGEARGRYTGVAQRDLFRPYRPPVVTRPPPRQAPPPAASPPPPPDPSRRMKVVALPDWGGECEVSVLDTQRSKVITYKLGESLAGGRIVMIDYREMPMPGNEDVLSGSRVILADGSQYWAIELGQMLSQKRLLDAAQLPPGLCGEAGG